MASLSPRSRIRSREDMQLQHSSSEDSDTATDITANTSPKRANAQKASDTFKKNKIRQDYIDAVFGKGFFPSKNSQQKYQPPRQGMGLAKVPSYVTYQANIPPPPVPFGGANLPLEQGREPKLGMTLSKLSLGLYVQALDPNAEAVLAGVRVGSILVAINGMGMLVEPSRNALERIWQYEGIFDSSTGGSSSSSGANYLSSTTEEEDGASASSHGSTNPSHNHKNSNNPQRPRMQEPIALTFLKDGKLYTAVLVAKSTMGIQWASCGNFCLVNRAYSYASSVGGVRRGSIIVSVNGTSLRELDDHNQVGETLRRVFADRKESLNLWLAYTPAAGRTGYWERMQQQQPTGDKTDAASANASVATRPGRAKKRKSFTQKRNGVEIRVHSFEESWQSLWNKNDNGNPSTQSNAGCGGPISRAWSTVTGRNNNNNNNNRANDPSLSTTTDPQPDDLKGSVAELANRVVEGETKAPMSSLSVAHNPHWSRQQRVYGPCPSLPKAELVRIWDPLHSLMFCLQSYEYLQALSCSNTSQNQQSNDCDDMPTGMPTTAHGDLLSDEETTVLLKQLASEDMIQTFLWQFISVIASYQTKDTKETKPAPSTTTAAAPTETLWTEEKKEDSQDPNLPPTIPSTSRASTRPKHFSTNADEKDDYNYGEVLNSLLLKLSRKDQDFCQRLYFCLRSTLKSLELDTTETTQEGHPKQQPPKPENHLLALFNCLQLLRSAEREALVDNVHLGSMMSVEQQWLNTSVMTTDTNITNASNNTSADLDSSLMNMSLTSSQKSEKRRMFGLFRKSKKKNKKKNLPQSSATSVSAESATSTSAAETAPSPKKKPQTALSRPLSPRRMISSTPFTESTTTVLMTNTTTPLLENMSEFIKELDGICSSIEKRLLKSISQKIADWALQPWSASKSTVLNTLTEGMRQSLREHSSGNRKKPFCLVNPLYSKELLVGMDPHECYILPSAHFPLLLTFEATDRHQHTSAAPQHASSFGQRGRDRSYRITVEVCNLSSPLLRLVVHGAIGGTIEESVSTLQHSKQQGGNPLHTFRQKLQFDSISSWGAPRTLSIRVWSAPNDGGSDVMDRGSGHNAQQSSEDGGFGWINLMPLWDRLERFQEHESYCTAKIYPMGDQGFDEQGNFMATSPTSGQRLRPMRLECKVSVEVLEDGLVPRASATQPEQPQPQEPAGPPLHKRMLLYKHDDDLRQEAFAIQFVKTCDTILKASGLDLKLLTFDCIPVGADRGFIEWVEGSVPLSDICQRPYSFFGTSSTTATSNSDKEDEAEDTSGEKASSNDEDDDMSMIAKAGMPYESLYRMGMAGVGNAAATAMKNTRSRKPHQQVGPRGCLANNPIQDFLRSIAFDAGAPYFVSRPVMDTFVKSCAGYCVITYLLGVGDRHLDNLLLHNQTGCFFHCDYSFLFGRDPKKYLPMRVTEDMVFGLGGRESDNYAKFLSLTGCAFVTLRQPENVRLLLSLVRVMEASRLPDLVTPAGSSGSNSSIADAVLGLRQRLRLDLTEEDAVAFMEEMIESSLSSKLWMAVDAIHSLGKRF